VVKVLQVVVVQADIEPDLSHWQ
jgi:hypothetical protein